MTNRSVHGGEDSHLSIEVSAVRGFREPDGIGTCNHEPETAESYAVYICNPLAAHLIDFGPDTTAEDRRVTMPEAKAAAFRYADFLGEHLGCPVVSALARPETIEGTLKAAGFTLRGGGSAPDFWAYEAPDARGHIVATSEDGGAPSLTDWLLCAYYGPVDGGQNNEILQRDSRNRDALSEAIAAALGALAAIKAPIYAANLTHAGGVYRHGEPIAFCRGDEIDARVQAERIAAAMNRAEG